MSAGRGDAGRGARGRPPRETRALALALPLAVLLVGCAPHAPLPTRPAPETLPAGSPLRSRSLRESDAWLRHYLITGDAAAAVESMKGGSRLAPRDRLVRALQEGVVLRQAGDYAESNRALEWAEGEVDRRYTQSLSRAAASLVVNDGVIAYTPPAAERAMVPYYRMLNYLALGAMDEALVEARKTGALLDRLDGDAPACREDGLVLYLAGLVQRAGGEANDALVSLRQAERAFLACEGGAEVVRATLAADLHAAARAAGVHDVADSVAARYSLPSTPRTGGGDLVLLVEEGFVAHREERALHVPIFPEEVDGLESDDEAGIGEAAGRIAARLLSSMADRAAWGRSWDDEPLVQFASAMEGAHVVRLAWPALRLESVRPAAVRVWVDDSLAVTSPVGDLSRVMEEELEARRAAALARLVARAVTKFLVTREMEQRSEEKGGEVAGFIVGRLANLAANRLEQADLRSWSLLPDRISLVRARLPEGSHRVRIQAMGAEGEVVTEEDLGEVTIRGGAMVVLSRRLWDARSAP